MRAIVTTLLLIALGAGGYYLYQDPRVSDLFKPLGKGPQTPSRANQRSRENEGLKKRQTRQQRATGPTRAQEVVETGPEQHQNQVPNGQVSRVLRQILLAKNWAATYLSESTIRRSCSPARSVRKRSARKY